jgi:Flp pilus assembly pilin Flp
MSGTRHTRAANGAQRRAPDGTGVDELGRGRDGMTMGRLLGATLGRVVRVLRRDDRGASAIEWAIIAAVAVVMISIVGAVLVQVVGDKSQKISDCANQPVGSSCTK